MEQSFWSAIFFKRGGIEGEQIVSFEISKTEAMCLYSFVTLKNINQTKFVKYWFRQRGHRSFSEKNHTSNDNNWTKKQNL